MAGVDGGLLADQQVGGGRAGPALLALTEPGDRERMGKLVQVDGVAAGAIVDGEADGVLLEWSCPFLAAEAGGTGGAALLLRVHALAIGIAQLADPLPAVQAVLGEPGMESFRVEARPMLEETLAALLVGLAQTRSSR